MTLEKQWISFNTILRKEITRFIRIWPQTILPSIVTVSLYFLIFGAFLGPKIGEVSGFTYMEFVIPGLVMLGVVTNSFSNVASSFFSSKFQKNIEELLISPTPGYVVIAGYAAGGVLRGLIVGTLVAIVAFIFSGISVFSYFIIMAFMAMTAALFSVAGFINGMLAKKFDSITVVPVFVLTPLIYLGGVFYQIDFLPQFWQTVSKINPMFYIISGFRYGFLGISEVNILSSALILLLFTTAFTMLSYYLFKKGYGLRE